MIIEWENNEIEFLKQNFHHLSNAEIGKALGRTKEGVNKKCWALNQLVLRDREAIDEVLSQAMKRMPKAQKIVLVMQALQMIKQRHLPMIRTEEELNKIKSRIAGNRFKNGTKPWNAGTRGVKKANSGSFQPGNSRAKNQLYDNAIVIKEDKKTGRKYKMIRIAPNQWEYLQRHNWEKTFGPIPEGYSIGFADGDSLNCDPGNLICLPSTEIMLRNSVKQRMRKINRKSMLKSIKIGNPNHQRQKKIIRKKPSVVTDEIPVRIDAKTVILAKAGQDPAEVKRKYLERMNANPSK